MDLQHLPILDWSLALRLCGNQQALAEEMHALFIAELPTDLAEITHLHQTGDYAALLQKVHKLHGGLCYLGATRLKTVVARLETELKSHIMIGLPDLFQQLNIEVTLLLEDYARQTSTFKPSACAK